VSCELPPGWAEATVGDLVEFNYGKGLPKKRRDSTGKVPVYGSNGVVGTHSEAIVKGPCIVVGRKGTAGACHLSQQDCWPIDTTYFVHAPDGLSIRYLHYGLSQLRLGSLDTSTAIPGLNRNDAYRLPLPLPSLNEQRRIVAKIEALFSELDAGVAALERSRALLARYRQSLLQAAFSGELTADWRAAHQGQVEPASVLLERIRAERAKQAARSKRRRQKALPPLDTTALPDLPEGWCWARLGEIGDVRGGLTKGRDLAGQDTVMMPYLRVANVQAGYLDLSEIKYIELKQSELGRYLLHDGDILFTEGGDRDKLGRGHVWRGEIDRCVHQNHVFAVSLFGRQMLPFWVSIQSQSEQSRAYFWRVASQTVNLASINMTKLRQWPVAIAPIQEQSAILQRMDDLMTSYDHLVAELDQSLSAAARLRQAILKRAFEGRLVPQDPTDEPAAALLDRIRNAR